MKPRIVIKLGGSSLQNPETLKELAALVRGYRKRRYHIVLVHGGGPAINEELTHRGIQWKFIDGQRQTTPEIIDVIDEVLGKDVNGRIVKGLLAAKIPAVGLSGAHDQILHCVQANVELMQVGRVESVDIAAIEASLAVFGSPVPVIAPIGIGLNGEKYNVNADWAATQIAIALKARKLIFLTDQTGILDENKQLVSKATPLVIEKMIESGAISGGMCTKVRAMMMALGAGLKKVRVLHAGVASQLLGEYKIGTLLTEAQPQTQKEVIHGFAS